MQWSPHINSHASPKDNNNSLLVPVGYQPGFAIIIMSAPIEQYYSTATGKCLGCDPNLPYLYTRS
jgi:hypothetical protein